MPLFFTTDSIGVRGLHIPFLNAELREPEFANDTTLHLYCDFHNIYKIEMVHSTFCKASGALFIGINRWHFGLG